MELTKLERCLNLGCIYYDWRHTFDPRIKETCDKHGIIVLEIPEYCFFKYALRIVGAIVYTDVKPPIVVVDTNYFDMENQDAVFEFAFWHEIGHIMENSGLETVADGHALERVTERYGRIGALVTYGRFLEKVYKYNRQTGIWDDTYLKNNNAYNHRIEDLKELSNFMAEYPYD